MYVVLHLSFRDSVDTAAPAIEGPFSLTAEGLFKFRKGYYLGRTLIRRRSIRLFGDEELIVLRPEVSRAQNPIWSMKKNEEAAAKKKPKTSAAQIRVQKDLTELELPSTMKTSFADPADILNFTLTITPDEGMYKGGSFDFSFTINNNYPHEPPKVKCIPTVYHPNLDLDGNVCLNILREDWKPVLNLTSVMVGLQYLFLEPNPDDPLNKEAAEDLRRDRDAFVQNVKRTMAGGSLRGTTFTSVIKR
ncbi:NEDD8-conjugating protein ubc12 [Tulasnella sp. 417]|nr:NEDD8-conjugating protein ubc12 [Tulasnella sp. 417]